MSDPPAELEALVDRIEHDQADGSLDSERAVQLRAVEPLIETLGWDVRGQEVVPEATVGTDDVDYLLTIEGAPAVAVVTGSPGDELQNGPVRRLELAIEGGHVPRAIAIDGDDVVLLVASDGEIHQRSFPITALHEHAGALGQYHRSTMERAAGENQSDREAAKRLAANRQAVAEAITTEILSVTGTAVEDAVAAESDRLVEAVIGTLRPDEVDAARGERSTSPTGERSAASPSPDGKPAETAGSGAANPGSTPDGATPSVDSNAQQPAADADSTASADHGTDDREVADANGGSDGDTEGGLHGDAEGGLQGDADGGSHVDADDGTAGEYVARFFGGSSSVGAVGTETPRGTTVGTVRYLLENHDLSSSVTFPWRDGDGRVVLAAQPEDRTWPCLENDRGDSVYVRPVDDPAAATRTIEALADAAGLRVMFQGDW